LAISERTNIVEKLSRLIEAKWSHDEQQKKIYLTSIKAYPNESSGENNNFNFHLFFENNKLAYMNIYPPNVPKLGGYKIQDLKTPVLAEGEFAIPSQK
jgi:hypothetical protein